MKLESNSKIKKIHPLAKQGFSLLEVLMALFVLSIGALGMLTLISGSVVNSNEARDFIVASQLAQEGIELVHNQRDTNIILDPSNVFAGLGANVCRVDVVNGLTCPSVVFNLKNDFDTVSVPNVYRFVHSTGVATKFSRKIVIEAPSSEERRIKSFVFWGSVNPVSDGSDCLSVNKCIYAETVLTDWAQE